MEKLQASLTKARATEEAQQQLLLQREGGGKVAPSVPMGGSSSNAGGTSARTVPEGQLSMGLSQEQVEVLVHRVMETQLGQVCACQQHAAF